MADRFHSPNRPPSLRFNMRTLLLLTIAVGVWLGWLANSARRQREAVEYVKAKGGLVRYDHNSSILQTLSQSNTETPAPEWLVDLLGVDYFSKVEAVLLPSLGYVSEGRRGRFDPRDELDLRAIAALRDLEQLDLRGRQIKYVTALGEFTDLVYLQAADVQVLDASPADFVDQVGQLDKLEALDLAGTEASDFSPLEGLSNLQSLNLSGATVADLTPLGRMKKLSTLTLDKTNVSDIAPLSRSRTLVGLSLNKTKVADVAPLAKMQSLTWLSLRGTQVVDVTVLVELQNLGDLRLNPDFSIDQVQQLQMLMPNCEVSTR